MKKKLFLGISVALLGTLASCTTENLPTEASGKKVNSLETVTIEQNGTTNQSFAPIKQDTLRQSTIVISTSNSVMDNGDLATIKDKRK